MIFVKRWAAPEIFITKKKAILEEIESAKAFFDGPDAHKSSEKQFKFYKAQAKIYKSVLAEMFANRCAYCESNARVAQRGDVEHFRPKGEFVQYDGKEGRPGYFWLAADWNNLYLSCTNCNQETKFRIIDAKDPSKVEEHTIGKKNHFGLSDESFRLNYDNQSLIQEEPYRLLIDPCNDDPARFLTFTEVGIVKPNEGDQRVVDMARYSIRIYGLQREELVKERKETYLQLMERIVRLRQLTDFVIEGIKNRSNQRQHKFNVDQMQQDFSLLMDMLDASQKKSRYIGLCRQHAEPFLVAHWKIMNDTLQASNKRQPWYPEAVDFFLPQLGALKRYHENKYPKLDQ